MKKSKKILLKWAATYGADEEDVRASMYNEDMMIEFAKYYHKQKLTLTDVVKPSLCELYDFGRQNKACEKKCNSCKWMEEQ
tara:strand:- start:233 stop:475 length:243 start_codon:yes stop_codon:yes gene_type:complete